MKKLLLFLMTLLMAALFSGCWDNAVIEENTIITTVGIDSREKDDHTFTLASVNSFDDKDSPNFITVKADIMSQALIKANNRTVNPVKSAKIQCIVFNREGAEQGYIPLAETHKIEEVSRFIPDYMVTVTTAREILDTLGKMGLQEKSLTYLNQLAMAGAKSGYCPDISSYDFNIDFLGEGPDPILPMLDVEDDKIYVKGTALFSGSKMVGELSADESIYLNLLKEKNSAFSYYVTFPVEDAAFDDAIFQTKRCNAEIAVKTQGDNIIIDINLNIKGVFDKFVWTSLSQVYDNKKISNHMKNYFNTHVKEIFTLLQSCYADPCNIRGALKQQDFSFYNTHDFNRVYNKATVNVSTDIQIINDPNPDIRRDIYGENVGSN